MASTNTISDQFISQVDARLSENKRVRRNLPIWGRVHIDRQLPFLCAYRRPTRRQDEGTERLIMGQPSYLIASGHRTLGASLSRLTRSIVQSMSSVFGGFLIVEIWSGLEDDLQAEADGALSNPAFNIVVPNRNGLTNTIETLENELASIAVHQIRATVNLLSTGRPVPPRFPTLVPEATANELSCQTIGIVVKPVYRHLETGESLPLVHQAMIRDFNLALQRTFFTFVRTQTKYRPPHYQMLGRHATVKAVWQIDKRLADIGSSFDFLLQVTPVNAHEAWTRFKRHRFECLPAFHYRPHAVDPALLKRQLWNIRVERVEDPTLQHMFREKRKELDIQISMLGNRNKSNFLFGSMQLYGQLGDQLITTARELLETIKPHSRGQTGGRTLNARELASYARTEIARYRHQFLDFDAQVFVRHSITGLLVSHGNLLVGERVRIPESRVEALLGHEIGTHLLTYYNGKAQPFKLLYSGLAGYEVLQEGIAVLAEYLVGGLSKPRLRLLAARVMAAQSLIDGATFIDAFRLLKDTYGLKQRLAFNVAMRVFRAGGLTKDIVYLRGLIRLLRYLVKEPFDDLFFIGKIGIDHIPIIQELRRRRVLQAPSLHPHFLNAPQAASRLERLSQGLSVLDLIERREK
jgi:uncharacterized protein (TIGR02421 family)